MFEEEKIFFFYRNTSILPLNNLPIIVVVYKFYLSLYAIDVKN